MTCFLFGQLANSDVRTIEETLLFHWSDELIINRFTLIQLCFEHGCSLVVLGIDSMLQGILKHGTAHAVDVHDICIVTHLAHILRFEQLLSDT